jgi:hypothetical protein
VHVCVSIRASGVLTTVLSNAQALYGSIYTSTVTQLMASAACAAIAVHCQQPLTTVLTKQLLLFESMAQARLSLAAAAEAV